MTAQSFVEWLESGRPAADALSAELLAIPEPRWDEWWRHTPAARTPQVVLRLLDAAYGELHRDPRRALALTTFILRHVDAIDIPPAFARPLGLLVRGRAWMEHGNALRATDLRGALAAFVKAAEIFGASPVMDVERAAARRGEALVRNQLGETGAALSIIREGVEIFDRTGDAANVTRSRIYEGIVLFESGRYEDAASAFLIALDEAAAADDTAAVAHIYNNLGQCAQMLRDRPTAIRHLSRALTLFQQHGMAAQIPIACVGLAHLLADQGNVKDAIEQLASARDLFVAAGKPLDAASTQLDMVEMLVLAGHESEAEAAASGLVERFERESVPREAMRALTFAGDAARERALTVAIVQQVRTFLRRLDAEPQAVFTR